MFTFLTYSIRVASHSYREAAGRARGCRCAKRARVPPTFNWLYYNNVQYSPNTTYSDTFNKRISQQWSRQKRGDSITTLKCKISLYSDVFARPPKEWKLSVPKHGRTDSLPGRANTQSEHIGQTSRSQLSKYVGVSLCFQRQKVCCVHSHLRAIVLNNWTRKECGVQFLLAVFLSMNAFSGVFPVFSTTASQR